MKFFLDANIEAKLAFILKFYIYFGIPIFLFQLIVDRDFLCSSVSATVAGFVVEGHHYLELA